MVVEPHGPLQQQIFMEGGWGHGGQGGGQHESMRFSSALAAADAWEGAALDASAIFAFSRITILPTTKFKLLTENFG
jgi:hypothetical protein